ncbi:DUF5677 domain-containing protein [Rhizobium leguminosarum]|uniref:DUF5677 domain-containing protein n=1 Tax=Rhizobium leguminosarum TaxID=384 RepID=UPI001440ECE6|nr:DUF5677 domain-containing protein [Rhizobium leguminosarum]
MLQLLQQSIKTSEDLTSALRFDKRSELARTIISLYLTIIEQCDSQVALIKLGKYAGVEAIFRSTLEAYIDLVNLIKDDAFLDHMKASHSDQWIKLAKEAMNGGNDFLATFSRTPENKQILADHESDIKAFKERGIHPLTVKQRFERAGKGDMYTSVYK